MMLSLLPPDIRRRLFKLRDQALIPFNKILNRTWVPHPREMIYIETSGICNLTCRFCGYSKKIHGKQTMSMPMFIDVIEQATKMGYHYIGLTPLTGEIFFDKGTLEKLLYLENHPRIKGYHFYTNFIIPEHKDVDKIFSLKKLRRMHVSLYGHDQASFQAITQKGTSAYRRLVTNIEYLAVRMADQPEFPLQLGWRTGSSALKLSLKQGGDIIDAVRLLESRLGSTPNIDEFNNWGGTITPSDVTGLGIELNDGHHVIKDGICVLLLARTIILADGRVNACACRDMEGTLVIGDINEKSLAWILSSNNQAYKDLLASHREGRFPEVCQSCDFYQSVYLNHAGQPYEQIVSLGEALNLIENKE